MRLANISTATHILASVLPHTYWHQYCQHTHWHQYCPHTYWHQYCHTHTGISTAIHTLASVLPTHTLASVLPTHILASVLPTHILASVLPTHILASVLPTHILASVLSHTYWHQYCPHTYWHQYCHTHTGISTVTHTLVSTATPSYSYIFFLSYSLTGALEVLMCCKLYEHTYPENCGARIIGELCDHRAHMINKQCHCGHVWGWTNMHAW